MALCACLCTKGKDHKHIHNQSHTHTHMVKTAFFSLLHTQPCLCVTRINASDDEGEMDNREVIDFPQALLWPATHRGQKSVCPKTACPVLCCLENSEGLNTFHLSESSVLKEPLEQSQ